MVRHHRSEACRRGAVQIRQQLQQAQKLESIGRLAGGVAHDFNNLLTVINGYSGLLLRTLTPTIPFARALTEISIAGERAAALSRQLLLLSPKQVVPFHLVEPQRSCCRGREDAPESDQADISD